MHEANAKAEDGAGDDEDGGDCKEIPFYISRVKIVSAQYVTNSIVFHEHTVNKSICRI